MYLTPNSDREILVGYCAITIGIQFWEEISKVLIRYLHTPMSQNEPQFFGLDHAGFAYI